MNDQPADSTDPRPEDPGERMRRLLSADDNEENLDLPPDLAAALASRRAAEAGEELPAEEIESLAGEDEIEIAAGVEDQVETPDSAADTSAVARHPTGVPDETGGWYGQMVEEPSAAEKTRPSPVHDPGVTRPNAADLQATRPSVPPAGEQTVASRRPMTAGPLPTPVSQEDPQATQVSPSAYQSARPRPRPRPVSASATTVPSARPGRGAPPPSKPAARQSTINWGCLARLIVGALFGAVLVLLVGVSFVVFQYFTIAAGLPSVDDLRERASQFETTRILDRNGNVIYEIIDPNAGRRTYVPLERISPYVIAATLATEDKDFYSHPGFDVIAIGRAFWQNYTAGDIASGASTITQQLARTLLLSPDERYERSYERKTREIVLAAEITRQYSKEDILELYLNENFYGKMAYGIEAAAETYFNTSADQLTLGQAAFLAGLPQSPSVYDIETNRPATIERFRQVLVLMYQLSEERGCIFVGENMERVCVDGDMAAQAVAEIASYEYTAPQDSIRFPHWVDYIRTQLEAQFDPQTIYRSGFTVFTTLDPALQEEAQRMVTEQVQALVNENNAHNGALVAIRPSTGEILAMIGSPDFENEAISGQINMAVQPRQPGSSIKPLTYTAAFEHGWTPATLIWDIPKGFPPSGDPNDPREPYRPDNYDMRFHGPVTVRSALANSYNVPAVEALEFVGIYDHPATGPMDGFIPFAQRLGITTLTRPDYGLSLTLGGGDVSLLELTSAFSAYAYQGKRVPPVAISRIIDHEGTLIYDYQPPAGEQVIRPEHAFLISSILSDNQARTPMFGANSALNLPFQAAAKTGTTNEFRDNWTVGYTPDLAVGVWIGNADYTPMVNTTGLTGAAPIWSSFMQFAVPEITGGAPSGFTPPSGIVDRVICEQSGTEPSEWCPSQRTEWFAIDQPPLPKEEDLWQEVEVDTWTGLKASGACSGFSEPYFVINVEDEEARDWIVNTEQGQEWAHSIGFEDPLHLVPERDCQADDPRPTLLFANLQDGLMVRENPIDIYVVAHASANFESFRLEWGEGEDPESWDVLEENIQNQYQNPELIHSWDVSELPAGMVTLRLRMESTGDGFAEKKIRLNLQVPTPTPTLTPTATATQIPTATLTPRPLPSATRTPVPLPSATQPQPTEETPAGTP